MTETHERRLSHKELTHIVVTCPRCRAEFVLDPLNRAHTESLELDFGKREPKFFCSFCGAEFDTTFRQAIGLLTKFLYYAKESPQEIIFRLPVAGTEGSQPSGA